MYMSLYIQEGHYVGVLKMISVCASHAAKRAKCTCTFTFVHITRVLLVGVSFAAWHCEQQATCYLIRYSPHIYRPRHVYNYIVLTNIHTHIHICTWYVNILSLCLHVPENSTHIFIINFAYTSVAYTIVEISKNVFSIWFYKTQLVS